MAAFFLFTLVSLFVLPATSWCELYVYAGTNAQGPQWGPMDISNCWDTAENHFQDDIVSSARLFSRSNYTCTATFYMHCTCFDGSINPSEILTVDPNSDKTINFGTLNNEVSCIRLALDTPRPTEFPSIMPTHSPSINPTFEPSTIPTREPTYFPTNKPTNFPSFHPTLIPTHFSIDLTVSTHNNDYQITEDRITTEYWITQMDIPRENKTETHLLLIVICVCLILCCVCIFILRKFGFYKTKLKQLKSDMSKNEIVLVNIAHTHSKINREITEMDDTNVKNNSHDLIQRNKNNINNTFIQEFEDSPSPDIINGNDTATGGGTKDICYDINEASHKNVTIGMDDESNCNIADDEFIVNDANGSVFDQDYNNDSEGQNISYIIQGKDTLS